MYFVESLFRFGQRAPSENKTTGLLLWGPVAICASDSGRQVSGRQDSDVRVGPQLPRLNYVLVINVKREIGNFNSLFDFEWLCVTYLQSALARNRGHPPYHTVSASQRTEAIFSTLISYLMFLPPTASTTSCDTGLRTS